MCCGPSESLLCRHASFKLIYNGLHGRYMYITQTALDEIYKHAFYVCAIWDTQVFSLKNYCVVNTKSYCSDVCGYHRLPQTLAEICRNMGICCSFRAVATRGKYMFILLQALQPFLNFRNMFWKFAGICSWGIKPESWFISFGNFIK